MKQLNVIILLVLVLLVSCNENSNPPVFTLPDINQEGYTTISYYHEAVIVDAISIDRADIVVKLYYSTDSKIGQGDCEGEVKCVESQIVKSEGSFLATTMIIGLQDNTTYYYMYGFVSEYNEKYHEGNVSGYSDVKTFTTLKNQAPEVITHGSMDVGFYTASLSAEKVSDNSDIKATEWGICYSTESDPSVKDSKRTSVSNDNGKTTFYLAGLTPNTTYYYRAYGINKYGTSYGEVKSFTTVNLNVMNVETNSVSNIESVHAVLSGKVTVAAGVNVSEKGFYVSSTNSTPQESDRKLTSTVVGEGSYQCYADNLTPSTTYYVRAYAICQYGKIFGDVVTFTTGN